PGLPHGRGFERPGPVLGGRLKMVEVDGAVAGHSIPGRQQYFRGNIANRGRDGSDRDLAEILEDRVTREQHDGPSLVGRGEPIPSNLAPPHGSGQLCSDSQMLNSPRRTALRAYPARCFSSSALTRARTSASRNASRV